MKLLLVVADSVRRDAVDLTRFGGVSWTNAICAGSWTIPSMVAMVTGNLPHRVGVANWCHRRWGPPVQESLFVALSRAGFAVDVLAPNPTSCFEGWPGVSTVGNSLDREEVLTTLRRPGPRFVLLHHWWTHLPYLPERAGLTWSGLHEASETMLAALQRDPAGMRPRLRRMYAAGVGRFVDEQLPAYLEAFGEGTVMVTADHGESWGELGPVRHIYDLHGRWLADETTAVPAQLFHTRGTIPAQTMDHAVSTRAVGPTLAALAGVTMPHSDAPSMLSGAPMRQITVGSANCETPDRYPPRGADLWRYWSERTATGRGTFEAPMLPPELAEEHAAAVDSGEMPDDWVLRRDRAEARHAAVFGRLKRLGYLE